MKSLLVIFTCAMIWLLGLVGMIYFYLVPSGTMYVSGSFSMSWLSLGVGVVVAHFYRDFSSYRHCIGYILMFVLTVSIYIFVT